MGNVIKSGVDPHAFTAAMFKGIPVDEFLLWKKDPDKEAAYAAARQSAKAVNFGIPGGLSAPALRAYAKSTYGVSLTLEEATSLRNSLIEGYPELRVWLTQDDIAILARNLQEPAVADSIIKGQIWWARERLNFTAMRRVLAGEEKVGGGPYNTKYTDAIWSDLATLNENPEFTEFLTGRQPDEKMARRITQGGVSTVTGRIRGSVRFTQAKNSPFQGLAADGAALAIFALVRAGVHVVAFVHDEVVAEVPADGGSVSLAAVQQIEEIMVREMSRVCGDITPSVESAVMERWSKSAGIHIENGRCFPKREEVKHV
jgi:hypothetical protein